MSNFARIYSGGSQIISASAISLQGGFDGGGSGTGNFAQIRSDSSQSITVGSGGLLLFGGGGSQATASDNFASVYQAGTSGTQTINVGGSATITVFGGDGAATNVDIDNNHGSWAFIRADGTSQLINFTAPSGAIYVIGGDNGSANYAGINARFGSQTVSGSPDINIFGGTTGGVTGEGNWAQIYANAGQQSIAANAVYLSGGEGIENFARLWSGTQQNITAATMVLFGGSAGTANFAAINAPLQTIDVGGNVMLVGGASTATATSGGGARIGGFGGTTPSETNATLNVGGNLSMTGGEASDSGSAIGSGILGGQNTYIGITVGGNVTLNPGTVANAGSRIGSPAASIGSGIITVTAGGDIVMNGTASGIGTAIRTAGIVALQANSITQTTHTTIAAGSLDASTTAGASLLGAGNAVSAFSASNTTSGAIELLNTSPTLTLSAISQVGGAAVNIDQSGDLVLPNMTFTNGTISATGTASIPSAITVTAAGGTLSAAVLEVQPGGTLNLASGALGGAGDVAVDGTMNWTGGDLSGTGKVLVGSTGTLNVSGASSRFITNGYDLDNLGTVNLTHSGVVFANGTPTTFVTNSGVWNANQTAAFGEETGGGSIRFTNDVSGTVSRSAAGTGTFLNLSNNGALEVHGGTLSIDNRGGFSSAGSFLVDSGATLKFVNVAHTITGSFQAGSGAGTIDLSSTTLNIGANVAVDDAVQVPSGTTLNVNAGSSASFASVALSGGTLGGDGNLTVTASLEQTGGTQSGSGTTAIGAAATGTIGAQSLSRNLSNQGTLNLNGTTLSGSLSNGGAFNVGGAVSVAGGASQTGGTTTVPAAQTLTVGGPGFALAGGTLSGSGTIVGTVNNTGGTVTPGASAGILTIDGDYAQGASGAMTVELGGTTAGTEYDRLAVTGAASLNGTLNVLEGAVAPVQGTTYAVITCGTCTGTFATVNSPTINAAPTYGSTSFTLPFTAFVNTWSGGVSAAWEDPANWGRGAVPTASDDVVIDVPGTVATITVSSGTQAAHSMTTNEDLTLSGGSLSLDAPSTIGGALTLSGGTLAGAGNVTANGGFNWTSGTVSGTGSNTLTTNGATTLSGSSTKVLDGRTWINAGAATLTGGSMQMQNGAIINNPVGGSIDIQSDLSFFDGGSSGAFNNAGSLVKSAGTSFTRLFVPFNNSGTVTLNTPSTFTLGGGGTHGGSLVLNGTSSVEFCGPPVCAPGGSHTFAGTASISGSGWVYVTSNDVTVGGSYSVGGTEVRTGSTLTMNGANASLGALTINGGILAANGAAAAGSVDLSSGTLTGTGNLLVTGSLTQSGGSQTDTGTTTIGSGASGTIGAAIVSRPLTNQGTLALNATSMSAPLTNSGTATATSATLGSVGNSGTFNLAGSALSGSLTNSGTLNVSGNASAGGGIQQSGGLTNVPAGQTLGAGGTGLVLAGGTLMGSGTISGNVNNSAGTVAPGASPGILTINGDYTQGPSGVLAVDVGGTIAGSEYDQLVVNGNVSLDGNLTTTLLGSYVPLPGDSYIFVDATGTISGNFANISQPASLLPPVAGVSPVTGTAQVTVSVVSPSVPAPIEPSYNYTVVASEISSEPVENILVPVLGGETTTTSGDTTLEKKPPACS